MTGVVMQADLDLGEAQVAIDRLSDLDQDELAFSIGELLVTQTKTRIADDKTAPDGTPWAPWSPAYAATRSGANSLLVGEGNPGLLESITNYSSGPEARAGTNLVYGAIHQEGSGDLERPKNIPARPYLGVSDDNADEITGMVTDFLAELVQ